MKAHTMHDGHFLGVGQGVTAVGRYVMLLSEAFRGIREVRKYGYDLLRQLVSIGIESLPIVMLAAAFTGAVTTVQSSYQMESPFIPKSTIGAIVVPSIALELGVLITAFMLSGRVGARIAAEIGSMRVGDQIDALEVMGVNAPAYLILPRVIAGTLMFPMLYVAATAVGILAGIGVAEATGILTAEEFLAGARPFFKPHNVVNGATKAVAFGFLLTSVSCYKGFNTSGGAEGVGRSATEAAVLSCIYILFADYVLATTLL